MNAQVNAQFYPLMQQQIQEFILDFGFPEPAVLRQIEGGAYLEWHLDEFESLEVNILTTGAIHWSMSDLWIKDLGGWAPDIVSLCEKSREYLLNFAKRLAHS